MLEPNSVANPRHDDTVKSHSHPEYVLSVAATPCEATMHVLALVCFRQHRDDTRTRVPAGHDEFGPDRTCVLECGCLDVREINTRDPHERSATYNNSALSIRSLIANDLEEDAYAEAFKRALDAY